MEKGRVVLLKPPIAMRCCVMFLGGSFEPPTGERLSSNVATTFWVPPVRSGSGE